MSSMGKKCPEYSHVSSLLAHPVKGIKQQDQHTRDTEATAAYELS